MQLWNLSLAACALFGSTRAASTLVVPNKIAVGPSIAQFVSGSSALDGPKLTNEVNATSFDWWYFDAVSSDSKAAVVIVFYLSTSLGFPFVPSGSVLSVDIFATFPNGSLVFDPLADPLIGGSATITTNGDGASGTWGGTGFSFEGAPDLSSYTVTVDNPVLGIKGTLQLNSVAPAHYPCSPKVAGANLEVSPHIGWANAMPDANAIADFTILGEKLQFNGVGYHDKNWGDEGFTTTVASWYWGHGRLGPYSIVWFDVLGKDGIEYVSAYVALNGAIIKTSCSGIKVRPTGRNSQYPPLSTSGAPEGYQMTIDLGGDYGTLVVNITTTTTLAAATIYQRWAGDMTGGVTGGPTYTGPALYEQFAFDS